MKPQPLNPAAGVSMILVGMPGVGKTPFIASGGPTLIIHPPADNMDSIPPGADVEEIVVTDWESSYEALHYCSQLPVQENPDLWVWLDSISVWQDYTLADVLNDAIERKPARAVEKGGLTIPEFGPDVGEYGTNMQRIKRWVRDMHGFAKEGKFNLGITAHPFEWYDPIQEEDLLAPWIQGKGMVTAICGYTNLNAYLQEIKRDGESSQKVLFTKTPGFYGKDQFDCLPETKSGKRGLIDPTMEEFSQLLEEARKGRGKRRRAKAPAKKSKKAPRKK